MPIATQRPWVSGIIAGFLGATALAFWFLVIDASQGVPFRTPALLANSIMGVAGLETDPGLIALYTVIHYAVFVALGLGLTFLFARSTWGPSILLGVVLGFVLFDGMFYASVYVTGIDVVEELGWVEVLAGDLIAGLTVMGYLHLTGVVRPVSWWVSLADDQIVREGIVAGLIGAAVVAVWFFAFDLTQGRPFFTPAALGSALFLGVSDVDLVQVNVWTVMGYSVVHVAAFFGVGLVTAAIVRQAETVPPIILGAVLLFVTFEALILGLLAIGAEFLLGLLAWLAVAVGNLLAVTAIGIYLWKKHPKLKQALVANPFDRTV